MRFNLKKFSDYPTIIKSIHDANALAKVLLLDLDETLVSHKTFVYDRIIKYVETFYERKYNPAFFENLFSRIALQGTDGVLDFVVHQLHDSVLIEDLLNHLRTDLGVPAGFFRPGARETLTKLNENFVLKICTNGNEQQQAIKVEYLNKMLGFKIPTFYCSAIASKPSPQCLVRALGDTSPDHALFVGDSEVDYLAAVGVGVKFLNVSNLLLNT